MLAIKRQYKSNILDLSTPPQPTVNSEIRYMRCGRLITGKLLGTHWYQIQRYSAIVCEYIIVPDQGFSNLSFHVVPEEDVVWAKQVKPVCPDCGDHGYLSISGDEARECPRCNPLNDEVQF